MIPTGGICPPTPTTVAAGMGFPVVTGVTVGLTIWVTVRLFALLGRNSETRPATFTASPTATVGAAFVKTKTPSDVSALASGAGSWIQKPRPPAVRSAVTTPSTSLTGRSLSGEM